MYTLVEATDEKQSVERQSILQLVSALTSAIATVIARHRDGLRLELISDRMTDNIRVWTGVWEAEMIGFQQMSEGLPRHIHLCVVNAQGACTIFGEVGWVQSWAHALEGTRKFLGEGGGGRTENDGSPA